MADIEYNWYFLSIRPSKGWTSVKSERRTHFLNWLTYISSTYKIVEEKEGKESHIHALICLEEKVKVNCMIQKLRNNLRNMLSLGKAEIHASSNKNRAVQVVNDLNKKLHYISGTYKDSDKDKSKDYYKVLYENLKDIEKDKLKIKEFIIPEKKERLSTIDKIMNYMSSCINEKEFYSISKFETIFYEGQAENEIPILGTDYLEKKYIALSYCKIFNLTHKNYNSLKNNQDYIKEIIEERVHSQEVL